MIIPFVITTDTTFKDITNDLKEFKHYDLLTIVNNSGVMIELLITDNENLIFTTTDTNKGIIINRSERFDIELLPQYRYWVRSNTSGNGSLKIYRKLNINKNIQADKLQFVTSNFNHYFGKKALPFLISWDLNINNYTTNVITFGLENAYYVIDSGVLKTFYNGVEVVSNTIYINLKQKNKFCIYYDGVNIYFLIDYGVKKEFISEVRNIHHTNQKFIFSNIGDNTILAPLNDEFERNVYDGNNDLIWLDSISDDLNVNISPISFYTKDTLPLDYYSHFDSKTINGTQNFIALKCIFDGFVEFNRLSITSDKKITFEIYRASGVVGTPSITNEYFEYYDDFTLENQSVFFAGYCLANADKIITPPSENIAIRLNKGDVIGIIVTGATALVDTIFEFGV